MGIIIIKWFINPVFIFIPKTSTHIAAIVGLRWAGELVRVFAPSPICWDMGDPWLARSWEARHKLLHVLQNCHPQVVSLFKPNFCATVCYPRKNAWKSTTNQRRPSKGSWVVVNHQLAPGKLKWGTMEVWRIRLGGLLRSSRTVWRVPSKPQLSRSTTRKLCLSWCQAHHGSWIFIVYNPSALRKMITLHRVSQIAYRFTAVFQDCLGACFVRSLHDGILGLLQSWVAHPSAVFHRDPLFMCE